MKNLWTYCKIPLSLGLLLGFALGYLYGIGGFVHDLIVTGTNQGSFLALNALWGMPLIFGCLGLGLGLLFALIARIKH